MATVESLGFGQWCVLEGIPWETYVALRDVPANEHVRMTYDRGRLEIMSPSKRHEQSAALLDRLISAWAVELNIDIASCRTMTFQREDIERWMEPDDCYYIQHELEMRDKEEVDFEKDPPPDLAVEVDVTRKSIDKMPIYARFGVPEVWRYDRKGPQVYALSPEGDYIGVAESAALPGFPLREAEQLLRRLHGASETAMVRSFRDWVRKSVDWSDP
jgi:Uma2 family endonuclease